MEPCQACGALKDFVGICHDCFRKFSGGEAFPKSVLKAGVEWHARYPDVKKPNTEERALARELAAARKKYKAEKPLNKREFELIRDATEMSGEGRGMLEYWAAGPDRPASRYVGLPPGNCGQCLLLDLEPIPSGLRYCRKRMLWRAREDEACPHGERAVDNEEARDGLSGTLFMASWKRRPPGDDLDDDIPF